MLEILVQMNLTLSARMAKVVQGKKAAELATRIPIMFV